MIVVKNTKTSSLSLNYRAQFKMLHLVHDLVVGGSQGQVHGVHQLAELEGGWMSAVAIVALNLTSNFSGLNSNGANGDPSGTSDIAVIVRLVVPLQK